MVVCQEIVVLYNIEALKFILLDNIELAYISSTEFLFPPPVLVNESGGGLYFNSLVFLNKLGFFITIVLTRWVWYDESIGKTGRDTFGALKIFIKQMGNSSYLIRIFSINVNKNLNCYLHLFRCFLMNNRTYSCKFT